MMRDPAPQGVRRTPSDEMRAIIDAGRDQPASADAFEHRSRLAAVAARVAGDARERVELIDAGGCAAEWVGEREASRAVLYLHPGGYVAGSPIECRRFAGTIGRLADARVLVLDYRLAPEHPLPAALDDAVNAYRWMCESGADPARTAVAGGSAGGGLALAALQVLAARNESALPAAAFVLSPWVDLTLTSRSMTEADSEDPFPTRELCTWMADDYLAGVDARSPLASPLFADLRGLPPLHIEVGTGERLLDDSLALADRARQAGVATTLAVAPGAVHAFPQNAPDTPEAGAALERIACHLRIHLA